MVPPSSRRLARQPLAEQCDAFVQLVQERRRHGFVDGARLAQRLDPCALHEEFRDAVRQPVVIAGGRLVVHWVDALEQRFLLFLDGHAQVLAFGAPQHAGLLEPVERFVGAHESFDQHLLLPRTHRLLPPASEAEPPHEHGHGKALTYQRQQDDPEGDHLERLTPRHVGGDAEYESKGDRAAQSAPHEHVLPAERQTASGDSGDGAVAVDRHGPRDDHDRECD